MRRDMMDYNYKLSGELIIDRQHRETGEWLPQLRAPNTITATGRHVILQRLASASPAVGAMGLNTTRLIIKNGSNVETRRLFTLMANFPAQASPEEVTWRWADEDANQAYAVARFAIERTTGLNNATDYLFSEVILQTPLNKTADYNWYYLYKVTAVTASPAFTPIYGQDQIAGVTYSGLPDMLGRLAGLSTAVWDNNSDLTAWDWDNPSQGSEGMGLITPGTYPPNGESTIPGYERGASTQCVVSVVNQTGVGTPDRLVLVFQCATSSGNWRLVEINRLSNTVKVMGFTITPAQPVTSTMTVQFTVNITLS
jgi:hypothetical protein